MTDETTGGNTGAAGSNPAQPAEKNTDIDDARIIDEVITRPPSTLEKKIEAPPVAPNIPAPPPPAKAEIPLGPKTLSENIPPPAKPASPRTLSSSALSAGALSSFGNLAPPPTPPAPQGPVAEVGPLPVPSSPTPPSPVPLEVPAVQAPVEKKSEEVQKILGETRLPERPVIPDEKKEPEEKTAYDTSLASPFGRAALPTQINLSDTAILKKPEAARIESPQKPLSPVPPAPDTTAGKILESAASIVMPLRTLKNDFQDIVREKKMSVVRATALEQDKRRGAARTEFDASGSRKRRTLTVIFIAILLAALGSATLFGIAVIMRDRNGGASTTLSTSLLFAESTIPLILENLSAFDLKGILAEARQGGGTLGSITQIVPVVYAPPEDTADSEFEALVERPATLEEFFRALNTRTSPDLLRALDSEFFFGIHTVDENAPLFVIPVLSYERAFAGMLEWEATMNADFSPAFTPVPETVVATSGLLEKRAFEDLIMRNYDVRALKDDQGTVQLYYSFPTREFLIIAESPYSFAEILSRLRAERKL